MATIARASVNVSATGVANMAADAKSYTETMSGDSDVLSETQDIGTSSEIVTTGEIAAGGCEYIEITNLDETNFVSIGFENPAVAGTKTFKLKAGQPGLFPNPSGALYAIADTATVKILKRAVEL